MKPSITSFNLIVVIVVFALWVLASTVDGVSNERRLEVERVCGEHGLPPFTVDTTDPRWVICVGEDLNPILVRGS